MTDISWDDPLPHDDDDDDDADERRETRKTCLFFA